MTTQSKSKKKILIKITIGMLLTLSAGGYIFSGFSSYIRNDTDTVIRTVNGQDIKRSQILQERDVIAQKLGEIPQDMMIRGQIINQSLENLTSQTAISSYAKSLGIQASDADIATVLQSIKPFTDADGKFDAMAFKRILQLQKISIKDFKNKIADNLIRENYTTPMVTEFPLSEKVTKVFNDFAFTNIHLTAYNLDFNSLPQDVQKIDKPNDAQLKQIYNEKKETLKRPALKDIEYAVYNADTLKNTIHIDPKEISDFYQKNKDTLYFTPEKRRIFQIVFDDEKKALDAYAKISKDTNFQIGAKKLGYKIADIDLGLIDADALTDKAAQETVFSSPVGVTTKPIKTDFGYALYFTKEIQPESFTKLDAVTAEIKNTLFKQKLSHYLTDITPKIDDDLAGGAALSEITKKYGSQIIAEKNITHEGLIYGDKNHKKLNPLIPITDINDYNVGDDIPIIPLDDNQFILLKITKTEPERSLTFEEAKDFLATQDINSQKNTILTKLIKDLKESNTRQSIVKQYNIASKPYILTRSGNIPSDIYRPDFDKVIYATKKNQSFSYSDDNSAVLLVVDAVTLPKDIDETQADDFSLRLQKNYMSDILDKTLKMIRNSVTIDTNDDAFSNLVMREIGNQ